MPRPADFRRSDAELALRDAVRLIDLPTRRRFMGQTLSIGALSLLTGCDIATDTGIDALLRQVSSWNDRVQGWLFDPSLLVPTYRPDQVTKPLPFNAFYEEEKVLTIDAATYRLEVGGLVEDKRPWTLDDLHALPQQAQITRHICIEGWSAIGDWRGVPLRDFLRRVGADLTARYVAFDCADRYATSLDMASALHPQTQITLRLGEDILPPRNGFPIKIRVPTKLGFKNPKHVIALRVTNDYQPGFWERQGYNWFSGL